MSRVPDASSSHWRGVARTTETVGRGAHIPMQPSGTCRLSVHSYPQPRSVPVSPRRRSPDCSRCCCHHHGLCCSSRSPGGSESAQEGGREGGGGSPLALLFPSSQVPSPTLCSLAYLPPPVARLPPLPLSPRETRVPGPALPRQPVGGPLVPAPCPFPRAPLGGASFQAPGPSHQRSLGIPGRSRGLGKTERGLRRQDP